jgi:hypothetical protein
MLLQFGPTRGVTSVRPTTVVRSRVPRNLSQGVGGGFRQPVEHGMTNGPGVLRRAVAPCRAPEGLRSTFLIDGPSPRRRRSGHARRPDDESWRCPAPERWVHLQFVHGTPGCLTLGAAVASEWSGGSAITCGTGGARGSVPDGAESRSGLGRGCGPEPLAPGKAQHRRVGVTSKAEALFYVAPVRVVRDGRD